MVEAKEKLQSECFLRTLTRLLDSRTFSSAPNLAKLLRFCAEESFAGRRQSQAEIAKLLNYKNFDARQDSNVRREVGRLRSKLRDYYDGEGDADPIIISIPKASGRNGYRVEFRDRHDSARGSPNPRYLQLICEARHLWSQRTPKPMMEAIRLYEEAVREDPEHSASAQTGLAECYCFLAFGGFPPHDTLPKAKEWGEKAIAANPKGAVAYSVLAFVTGVYDWNWTRGDEIFQKALALAPQSVDVRCWYADHLISMSRFPEAIKLVRSVQALEHEPSVVVMGHLAKILYAAGDLDHAFDLLRLTLQINPRFHITHWHLGLILLERGDADAGLEHLRKAAQFAPEDTGVLATLGYALAILEHRQESLDCLHKLEAMRETRYVPSTDFATIYAGLGDVDAAFGTLEQAFVERCIYLTWLHVWPSYQPLRSDPRFPGMLRRIGLTDRPA